MIHFNRTLIIVISRRRLPYCLHWLRNSSSSYEGIKKPSSSALGQSKVTKAININHIRIMRIFHYKCVSKSVNSNMPYDET